MHIYLEFPDATAPKFWEGTAEGKQLTTRWGGVGATGQSKTATHANASAAEADLEKKAQAKIKKGYEKASPSTSPPTSSLAAAPNAPAKSAPAARSKTPPKSAPVAAKTLVAKRAPSLSPMDLSGDVLPLADYPSVFGFNPAGTKLAAHGISTLHIVDWATRQTSTYKSREARALLFNADDNLIVGTKSITLLDPNSGKKGGALKGHKAAAHGLATDGTTVFTGGGDFADTHDRFVRAFDIATGDLRWKTKPGKNAGALSLALIDDTVAVAAEDGAIRVFNGDDGTPLGEVQLAPPATYSSAFGGVARVGNGVVAATVQDLVCTVHWLRLDPAPVVDDVTTLPLDDVDPDEGMVVGAPQAQGGLVIVPVYYCIAGISRVVVAVFDATSHDLAAIWKPEGLSDNNCALSPDGTLVWAVADGLASARLV